MNKLLTVSSLLILAQSAPALHAQDAPSAAVQPSAAAVTPAANPVAAPAATPAAAAATTTPKQVAAADAKADAKKQDDKDKVVCRTVRVTGSNVRTQKVCTTPAQEEQSQEWMRKRQDRSGIENGGLIQSGG